MGKVSSRRRPNPQVPYARSTDAVRCECPPGTSLPSSSSSSAAAAAAAGPGFKVSSRRRKSMLPLGRPLYLFSKFTNPRRPTPPTPRRTPPPADPLESVQTNRLRQKLFQLELQGGKLVPREKWLRNKVRELRRKIFITQTALFDWERRSSLPYGVIPFVAAINQANRYFDFKEAAIRKYRKKFNTQQNLLPLDIKRILRDDKELNSKFNNSGDLELAEAAIAIFDKLHAKKEKKLQVDLQYCRFGEREDPALKRPIYNLVFQTRERGIVMDQDPVVELEKIMKHDPSLYDGCFLLEAPPKNCSIVIKEAHDSYTKFWSKYAKAASGAEPFVVKAEDADPIFPFTGTDPCCVFQTGPGVNLMKKLEALELQLDKQLPKKKLWDAKCQKVLDQMDLTQNALWESESRSALPYAVIPFVAKIEEANLYFEFKKAAKKKYRRHYYSTRPILLPFDISNILRYDEELNSKFKDFGYPGPGYQQVALAIFYELGVKLHCLFPESCSEVVHDCGFIRRKDPMLVQPIYNLVFQARKQRRVMDEDPIVEIEKIMESDPSLYDAYFNMSGKLVDGLETAMTEARIKYSEIWSTYFKAARGTKNGKQLTREKMGKIEVHGPTVSRWKTVDEGKDGENTSTRPYSLSLKA